MRILHIAESVKGGCGTYINQLARTQLADPTIEAVHAVLPDAHVEQIPDLPACNRTLFASPRRSAKSLASLWSFTTAAIQAFKPDCIHLHSTFAGAIVRSGLRLRTDRPAMIYCAHGWSFDMEGPAARRQIMALTEQALSHCCEGIVAISEHERRRGEAIGIARKRLVTVLNGIEDVPAISFPQSSPKRRILFVGRLDRQKGFDILEAALQGLSHQFDLRVIGTSVVNQQNGVVPSHPGMTSLGWCDQSRIREEMAAAECVIVPSRWEGFGLVAVEAMRTGRAVIASRVGGLPEVVEDNVTGWLVEPNNPHALQEKLLGLSAEQLAQAGAAGRQRFENLFRLERMAGELKKVYRQAIAMRSPISHAFNLGVAA